jgi:hypothetical protein
MKTEDKGIEMTRYYMRSPGVHRGISGRIHNDRKAEPAFLCRFRFL